jgi:hypothetical protein
MLAVSGIPMQDGAVTDTATAAVRSVTMRFFAPSRSDLTRRGSIHAKPEKD